MAAKPPKPPGNFLKELSDCISNNNKTNTKNLNKENNKESNQESVHTKGKANNTNNINCNTKNNALSENCTNGNGNENKSIEPTTTQKLNCSCTNITIMHLFHEMKQEFPTIPDTLVAQCVSENCHQRENCIQQLRNELALNPIPVQSYPGKVLHPPQRQQSVLKSTITSNSPYSPQSTIATPTTTPLKPTRPAPLQPPNNFVNHTPSPHQNSLLSSTPTPPFSVHSPKQKPFCDSVSSVSNNNNKSKQDKCYQYDIPQKDVDNSISESAKKEPTISKTSDMPTATVNNNCDSVNASQNATPIDNRENVNPNENQLQQSASLVAQPSVVIPRSRPTTLNLQSHQQQQQQQQQQQRHQVNLQLQKHIQQRNLQQQQQQQKQQQYLLQTKPLRKAPLPPIPPKPLQLTNTGAYSPVFNHNNNNSNNPLTHSQQSSLSNDSNLTSPSSSVGESEISVNVSLSSPIVAYQPLNQKSPQRHRSVINVHPEPPYSQNFIASSPTGSVGVPSAGGQKSFTSVNLTLRQPNVNSAVPASTIDISAGPGLSGNGSGLTYSSTSYDARIGCQKNFHITVTDEGGIFSASRIRPRSCFYPNSEHEQDGSTSPTTGNKVNLLRPASSEQCVSQQYQNTTNPSFHQNLPNCQNNIVAYNNSTEMCRPNENDVFTETVNRQKNRRDKLATALRDNKKRLDQVRQEIDVLAEPVAPGKTERLDEEIQKLRSDCQAMLNEIDIARRCGPNLSNNTDSTQLNRQIQPQPFPRQRHQRAAALSSPTSSGASPRQSDFIQHNSASTTPVSPSISNVSSQQLPAYQQPPYHEYNQQYQQLQRQQQQYSPAYPPPYQEYNQQYHRQPSQPQQPQQQQQQPPQFPSLTDEDDFSDSITDADDNEEEEPQEMWACNMCTFRNHPQLNICECCENVRAPRGTIRILPTTAVV